VLRFPAQIFARFVIPDFSGILHQIFLGCATALIPLPFLFAMSRSHKPKEKSLERFRKRVGSGKRRHRQEEEDEVFVNVICFMIHEVFHVST
jgi:hypothetical protein